MKSVSIETAQKNLPELLRQVEAGEELQLTRKKKVVAKIIPIEEAASVAKGWSEHFRKLKKIYGNRTARGKACSQIVIEGRR